MSNESTNIYLVAALFSYGADYVGVDRSDKQSQKFLFKEPLGIKEIYVIKVGLVASVQNPTFDEIKLAYESLNLMYPPEFEKALKRVKGIIYT